MLIFLSCSFYKDILFLALHFLFIFYFHNPKNLILFCWRKIFHGGVSLWKLVFQASLPIPSFLPPFSSPPPYKVPPIPLYSFPLPSPPSSLLLFFIRKGKIFMAAVVDEESGACSADGLDYLLKQKIVGGKGLYPPLSFPPLPSTPLLPTLPLTIRNWKFEFFSSFLLSLVLSKISFGFQEFQNFYSFLTTLPSLSSLPSLLSSSSFPFPLPSSPTFSFPSLPSPSFPFL